MIDETDIEAFSEGNADALSAAQEYARRAAKGLPPDRFTDGATGARLVAQGIHAMQTIMALQNDAITALYGELHARGDSATRLHSKDSKYNE